MKIISRIAAALTMPNHDYVCIRCDERKADVPYPGGYCWPCEVDVTEIAQKYPDVYAAYVRRHQAAGFPVPVLGERA